jgi:RHS repeat-associated protein
VVYYHPNTLFSVCALSDASGSVVERYRYDAYGGATVLDADGSVDGDGLSDVRNPYVFTARRLDPETGLMQYRNRYYSPVLGRFVSRDPLGYGDSRSLYSGLAGRPTVRLDPTGERTWTVEVGNPGLPHFFEMAPGVPAVITGTIWEVYNEEGHVVFREGVAHARPVQPTIEWVLKDPILGWRGLAGLGLISWSGRTLLDAYYGSQGFTDYWYGHVHCVNTCLMSRIHPWGPLGAWIAGDIKEVADDVACLVGHKEEDCYSAWQESDLKCNARGIIAARITDWRYGKTKSLIHAFPQCVAACELLKCGPRDGPSAPGPRWDVMFPKRGWEKDHYAGHIDYRAIPARWVRLPVPGEPQ